MFGFIKQIQTNREMQKQLISLFEERGLNFMHLHPTIHGVILKEAIISQDPNFAVEKFFATGELFAAGDESDDEKGIALLAYYQELDRHLR